ncbi:MULTISPECIES: VOC family protein [Pseudomonas]|uniref:VOC family protein n=1 Tax=Pseudomonas TaxID=286 RepID=UPI001E5ED2D1|nr:MULTISPECIES: VOC family protein [Pseudomonas]MCE1118390.1 VOC family protein [Pseudomonas sp. NMI795_08]
MPIALLLRCPDLERTRAFYRDVLGFNVSDSAQSTLTARLLDCTLVFTQEDLWQQPVACSGTFYLIIEDVEGYFAQVKGQADIAWPLQDMAHGSREFAVRDCNGYHLAFSQQQAR